MASNLRTGLQHLDALPKGDKARVDEGRGRFSLAATSLVGVLYNRAHYARGARLTELRQPD